MVLRSPALACCYRQLPYDDQRQQYHKPPETIDTGTEAAQAGKDTGGDKQSSIEAVQVLTSTTRRRRPTTVDGDDDNDNDDIRELKLDQFASPCTTPKRSCSFLPHFTSSIFLHPNFPT